MTWTINMNGHLDGTDEEKKANEEQVLAAAKELAEKLRAEGCGMTSGSVAGNFISESL